MLESPTILNVVSALTLSLRWNCAVRLFAHLMNAVAYIFACGLWRNDVHYHKPGLDPGRVLLTTPRFTMNARHQNRQLDCTPRSQRKSRRKTAEDVKRERKSRARNDTDRPILMALWAGVVLAESQDYEVCDKPS